MLSQKRDFWTDHRLTIVLRSLAILQLIVLIATYYYFANNNYPYVKGDFPPYYRAASLVRDGSANYLYDSPQIQRHLEEPFYYPPYVAICLLPLSYLSVTTAQSLFILTMLVLLIAALVRLRAVIPRFENNLLNATAALVLFAPAARGLAASQNTALSLFCYATLLYGIKQGGKHGDRIAGLALGAWFFKPQLPLLFALNLALLRRWGVLRWALLPLMIYQCLAVYLLGWNWPLEWLKGVPLRAEIFPFAHEFVNISGFVASLRHHLPQSGWIFYLSIMLWSLCAAIVFQIVRVFLIPLVRNNQSQFIQAASYNELLIKYFLVLTPLALLVSPYTLPYDLALLFPALATVAATRSDRQISLIFIVYFLVRVVMNNRDAFIASPLFLLNALALVYVFYRSSRTILKPQA